MLIVAKQDNVDDLYAIWNTVTDRFLGVNLHRDEAIKRISDYKGLPEDECVSRVDHPQSFQDIADQIIIGMEDDLEDN